MGVNVFLGGAILQFDYVNHEGKLSTRTVRFEGMDYGENEWYSGRQWFMRCYDLERKAPRSFALNRIHGDDVIVVKLPLGPLTKFEKFMGIGSEEHRQTYEGWRKYPLGMQCAVLMGFCIGTILSSGTWMLARWLTS